MSKFSGQGKKSGKERERQQKKCTLGKFMKKTSLQLRAKAAWSSMEGKRHTIHTNT